MSPELTKLHKEIDQRFDSRTQELLLELEEISEKREQAHKALDLLWPTLGKTLLGPLGNGTGPTAPKAKKRKKPLAEGQFPAARETRLYVSGLRDNDHVDSLQVFEHLARKFPEQVEGRTDRILKGQIARELRKLAARGVIALSKEGKGNEPNLYYVT